MAIVTGAASGIGRATTLRMLSEGAKVVVADLNDAGSAELVDEALALGHDAMAVHTDVSSESDLANLVQTTVATYGRVDVLHNNAADLRADVLGRDGDLDDMTADFWDRTFAVNLRSQMLAAKFAVPHMIAAGSGSIINMSSGASLGGDLSRLAYSAAKGSVNTLTKSIATMYGKRGIRCNAVAPGFVLSPPALAQVPLRTRILYEANCLVPFLGTPEDIAPMVVFLASDEARYITGQIMSVDGGSLSHLGTVTVRRAEEALSQFEDS